jgi:hypothetical protein
MQTKMLHAILSGAIVATVLGFSLIPATWQMITRQGEEPTFGPIANGEAVLGIAVAVVVIAITLLSFRLVKRAEE